MIRITYTRKMLIGVLLVVASVITSVVAANVNINQDNRVEFGQGLFQVSACDDFITVDVESDGVNITQLIIDGLDIRNCPGVYMRIKVYGTASTPLNLYQETVTSESPATTAAVNRIMLRFNGDRDRFLGVDYFNSIGQPIPIEPCPGADILEPDCITDGSIEFDYFQGRYRVLFYTPMATGFVPPRFTVETSSDKFTEISECDISPNIKSEVGGGQLRTIIIENLDVENCGKKYVRISVRDSSGILPLYQDSLTASVNFLRFYINEENDFLSRLDFIHSDGKIVRNYVPCESPPDPLDPYCRKDNYLRISYSDGIYRVNFVIPKTQATGTLNYLVESANELDQFTQAP
jgi:hypothetical protein